MNQRAAVIIIKDDKILLMHRRRNGKEYFAVPGGMVEDGETPQQAAVREAKEETNLDIALDGTFLEFEREIYEHNGVREYHGEPDGKVHEYFFLVESFSGVAMLGGEELEHSSAENHYALEWISLEDLDHIELLPPVAKKKIIEQLRR